MYEWRRAWCGWVRDADSWSSRAGEQGGVACRAVWVAPDNPVLTITPSPCPAPLATRLTPSHERQVEWLVCGWDPMRVIVRGSGVWWCGIIQVSSWKGCLLCVKVNVCVLWVIWFHQALYYMLIFLIFKRKSKLNELFEDSDFFPRNRYMTWLFPYQFFMIKKPIYTALTVDKMGTSEKLLSQVGTRERARTTE